MKIYDIISYDSNSKTKLRHLISTDSATKAILTVQKRVGDNSTITVVDCFHVLYGVKKGILHNLFEPTHGYRLAFENIDSAINYLLEEKLIPESSFYESKEIDMTVNYLPIWYMLNGEKEFTDYSINFIRIVENTQFNKNNVDYEEVEYWRD